MPTLTSCRAGRDGHRAGALLLATLGALFAGSAPARAQGKVCARQVSGSWTVSGVIAPGVATAQCQAASAWSSVMPLAFSPSGEQVSALPAATVSFAYVAGPPKRLFVGVAVDGDEDFSDQDLVYLFFDHNNDGSWDEGDFYLQIKANPLNPANPVKTPGGPPNCKRATTVAYYQHTGGGWIKVTDAGVTDNVVSNVDSSDFDSKAAADYDLTDPDHDLWNLELMIPIGAVVNSNTYYDLQTTNASFAVGAYVFVDKGRQQIGQTGFVLRWPSTMQDRDIAQQDFDFDYSSSPSPVKPTATQASELADAEVSDACFDVNFSVATPWVINNSPAAAGDHRLNRGGANTVRANFRFDGPGNAVGNLSSPNTGTVEVSLTPYSAAGHGPEWVKTQAVSLSQFNIETGYNFQFNFGSPPSNWPGASSLNFVCAWLRLKNFLRDDNLGNNAKNINFNHFTTSDYVHDVEIVGDRLPYLKPGQQGEILLRLATRNDPANVRVATLPTPGEFAPPLAAIAAAGLLVALLPRRRPRLRLGLVATSVCVLLASCASRCPRPTPHGPDRWQITNGAELGLRALKGEPDWYSLPIRQGETKHLALRVIGQPLPYKTDRRPLAAADAQGQPNQIAIPVRPGQVVTVVAFGEVDLDGDGPLPPTSPEGMGMLIPVGGDIAVPPPTGADYLLRSRRYAPSTYAGALIGSFDRFRTGFPVGRNASFVVPDGASELRLAINAALGAYHRVKGLYDLHWIVQSGPQVPTFATMTADTPIEHPRFVEPWRVLTSLSLYSFYQTEDRVGPQQVVARTRHAYGSVHYSVYLSHN